jgi:3-carboxy-cis,cis-muconate cycloisomerase
MFDELFVPDELREAVGDRAWVQAMLEFEAALARAQAGAGLIPGEAADAITAACADPDAFDPAELGRAGRGPANPAAPLVRALTDAVGGEAAGYVHRGATSQDVMDTAAVLVARRALGLIDDELGALAARCAELAAEHRGTVMAGRTLLQQALPTTFGLKAAGWLVAVLDARERLAGVPLAVQLGGAAGTLASLGERGGEVLGLLAGDLGLEEPVLPWHAARGRMVELGGALTFVAAAAEKPAHDVVLLAQTEVGEVAESGEGGSSTLPHKRNPAASVRALACARRARAEAAILIGAPAHEHERAAGAWQAEWQAVSGAAAHAGGTAAAARKALEGLQVHPERMRANLDATGGLILSEAVATALTGAGLGRQEAHDLVRDAARRAARAGRPLGQELADDPEVSARLSVREIAAALDPSAYLGSADAFVDRALARHGGRP